MSDPSNPTPGGERPEEGAQPNPYGAPQPGYGQPGYPGQQPGYPGQPGYGYGPPAGYYPPARETEQNAVVALVLSILAWAICPIVLAVVAIVVAKSAERNIAASGGAKEGAGLAKAARVISWINIAFYGVILVGGLLTLIIAVASTSST